MRRSLLAALVLSGPILGMAQPAPATPQVAVEFTVLGWGADTLDLGYRQAGKEIPLRIENFRRSDEIYRYTGPGAMPLYRYVNAPPPPKPRPAIYDDNYIPAPYRPPEGPLGPEPVATVPLPSEGGRLLLIVHRSGSTIQTILIPDDLASTPPGQIRFINLSPVRIGIRDDNGKISVLEPRGDTRFSLGADSTLRTRVAYERGDKWALLKDTIVHAPPDNQTTIVFLRTEDALFRTADGKTLGPLQMLTLRVPVKEETPQPTPNSR